MHPRLRYRRRYASVNDSISHSDTTHADTSRFILNGLEHVNQIYGKEIFHMPDWRVIGEYIFDEEGGRHQAFVSPVRETTVLGCVIKPHERIQIEQSLKYSKVGSDKLWEMAGLREVQRWTLRDEYGKSKDLIFSPFHLSTIGHRIAGLDVVSAPHTARCSYSHGAIGGHRGRTPDGVAATP